MTGNDFDVRIFQNFTFSTLWALGIFSLKSKGGKKFKFSHCWNRLLHFQSKKERGNIS